jgi:hypothetical protein
MSLVHVIHHEVTVGDLDACGRLVSVLCPLPLMAARAVAVHRKPLSSRSRTPCGAPLLPLLLSSLITTSTTPTPTAHALNLLVLLQLLARHAADTRAIEVRLLRLNAPQAAQLLVALLLPFRDQIRVRIAVLQQPVVQLLADGFFLVVEVVDVAGACGMTRAWLVSARLCDRLQA